MKVFSGSAHRKLAEQIAKLLGLRVSLHEKFIFPDGEERIRVLDKVVDEDILLVQPLSPPVNEHLIELLFLIDALKRNGAKSVVLIVPYLGYQRQDRVFREGEAVSLMVVIKLLEAMGVDKVVTFELHSIRTPEMFHVPLLHLSAMPLFAKKIKDISAALPGNSSVLIAPDMGGLRRVKQLALQVGNMPLGSIVKNRDLATGSVTATKLDLPRGMKDLSGKTVFVMDDMISGGGTIIKAVELLKEYKAKEIYVFVTHAIFSQNAPAILQSAPIRRVFVADTVLVSKEKRFPKLERLSIASTVVKALSEDARYKKQIKEAIERYENSKSNPKSH